MISVMLGTVALSYGSVPLYKMVSILHAQPSDLSTIKTPSADHCLPLPVARSAKRPGGEDSQFGRLTTVEGTEGILRVACSP